MKPVAIAARLALAAVLWLAPCAGAVGQWARATVSSHDGDTRGQAPEDPKVLLKLALADAVDPALDEADFQLMLYGALCPATPCGLGLLLEDVKVLSKSDHSVSFCIPVPQARVEALRVALESQLADASSDLRTAAFPSLLLGTSTVQVAGAGGAGVVGGASRPHVRLHPRGSTLPRSLTSSARGAPVAGFVPSADLPVPTEGAGPGTGTEQESLGDAGSTGGGGGGNFHIESPETFCVAVVVMYFVIFGLAYFVVCRMAAWAATDPPPARGQLPEVEEEEEVDDDEGAVPNRATVAWKAASSSREQQAQDEGESSIIENDFNVIKAIFQSVGVSMTVAPQVACLIFIIHLRAMELTRGQGDPPWWAEMWMMCGAFTVLLEGWFELGRILIAGIDLKVDPFTSVLNPRALGKTSTLLLGIMQVWYITVSIGLLTSLWQLTAENCLGGDAGLAEATWPGSSPPAMSLELVACFRFALQMFLARSTCQLYLLYHAVRLTWFDLPPDEDADEDERESKQRERAEDMDRVARQARFIFQTQGLAPMSIVLTLGLREVPMQSSVQESLKTVLLHAAPNLNSAYLVLAVLAVPFGVLPVFADGVVPPASFADYAVLVARDNLRRTIFQCLRWGLVKAMLAVLYTMCFLALYVGWKEEGGPASDVDWPVLWVFLMGVHCLTLHVVLLAHELFVGPKMHKKQQHLNLLHGVTLEVGCTVAICPMAGLLFILTQATAKEATPHGRMEEWILNAMNAVAQTLLTMTFVVCLEAHLNRFLHVDQQTRMGLRTISTQHSQGFDRGNSRGSAETETSDEEEGTRPEAQAPQDESTTQMAWSMQVKYVGKRVLKTFISATQLFMAIIVLCCTGLIVMGVLTMRERAKYFAEAPVIDDWLHALFPFLPSHAPLSRPLRCLVWLVTTYFSISMGTDVLNTLQFIYKAMNWIVYKHVHRANDLTQLMPILCFVCMLALSRAVSLHGVNSLPPEWMQNHMFVFLYALLAELVTLLLFPFFTVDFSNVERAARLVRWVRLLAHILEGCAMLVRTYGFLAVVVGVLIMRATDVMLPDGRSNVPFAGPKDESTLRFLIVNLLLLCVVVFFAALFHKMLQQHITRKRYIEGIGHSRKTWRSVLKVSANPLARWHRAFLLSRETSMGAAVLGAVAIPLAAIHSPYVVWESSKPTDLVYFVELTLFVASVLVITKTFFVFCTVSMEQPPEARVTEGLSRTDVNTQPRDREGVGALWRPPPQAQSLHRTLVRLTLVLTVCETLAIAMMVMGCFGLMQEMQWPGDKVVVLYNDPSALFWQAPWFLCLLNWIAHTLRFALNVAGQSTQRLDIAVDVSTDGPVLLVLFACVRQRCLELVGASARVPKSIIPSLQVASLMVLAEFILVLVLHPVAPQEPRRRRRRKPPADSSAQAPQPGGWLRWSSFLRRGQGPPSQELQEKPGEEEEPPPPPPDPKDQVQRVAFLILRSILHLSLFGSVSGIIFRLAWMIPEECLPEATL